MAVSAWVVRYTSAATVRVTKCVASDGCLCYNSVISLGILPEEKLT